MKLFSDADRSRAVAVWLFATAALVFGLVIVGGATRLTGSGLSITEWKPVRGVIPPLSAADWMDEFRRYQATPQYRFLNEGMSLAAFKGIYWWEWTHRLLARLTGFVFFVPLVVLVALRRLPRRLIWRCVVLFLLGGLQGLVGWWMVVSGLEGRVAVAPERLATHLGVALILYAALIWTGLEAWFGPPPPAKADTFKPATAILAVLIYIQCLLGALVAGNHAGLVDNDWPLMNGRVFPNDYVQGGVLQTLLHSQTAVQFNHRLVAYAVLVFALVLAVAAGRSRRADDWVRTLSALLATAALIQAGLGVATLMGHAPLDLSLMHQAGAAIVLAIGVSLAWRAAR